jgi:hypothetical protein
MRRNRRLTRAGLVAGLAVMMWVARPAARSDYCYDSCGPGVPCDWQCELSPGEWITCEEWGVCDNVCQYAYCGDGQCNTTCGEYPSCADCPTYSPPGPDCGDCEYGGDDCGEGYECSPSHCCVPWEGGSGGCVIHQDCNYPQEICVNGHCVEVMAWY